MDARPETVSVIRGMLACCGIWRCKFLYTFRNATEKLLGFLNM